MQAPGGEIENNQEERKKIGSAEAYKPVDDTSHFRITKEVCAGCGLQKVGEVEGGRGRAGLA